METTNKNFVNFIITKGNICSQLKYSLFKLLDWSIGNAVCITLMTDNKYIFINDCKTSLQTRLTDKIGGIVSGCQWAAEENEANINDVIREVTEWINEQ